MGKDGGKRRRESRSPSDSRSVSESRSHSRSRSRSKSAQKKSVSRSVSPPVKKKPLKQERNGDAAQNGAEPQVVKKVDTDEKKEKKTKEKAGPAERPTKPADTERARREAEEEEKLRRKRRRWDASTAEGDELGNNPSAPPVPKADLPSFGVKVGPDGARVPQSQSVSAIAKLRAYSLEQSEEAADERDAKKRLKATLGIPDVEALKAQTQARLVQAGMDMLKQRSRQNKDWKPLLLDKQGRQIDEQGRLVVIQKETTAELLVNKKLRPDAETLQGPGKKGSDMPGKKEAVSHIDPRVDMPAVERERRTLRFVKPGKYIARAQTMRMKQISREMRSHQFETTEEGTVRRQIALEPIPDVEWWDEIILDGDSYDAKLKENAITNMIHVPILLDPVAEAHNPAPMQMMLTQKERKKIKRIKKQEKQKEEQDKIRLGLIQPPEPKMRLSNLMRVLGNEAISEPSKMEAKVRKQMGERQEKHQEHNEARSLTADQKREKKRKKLTEDTNIEVHVAVFRAGDLTDGKRKFKVDIHAQQYNLTGATVIYGNCNVVVVEGGPKSIKKFKQLMLKRIKWMPDDLGDEPAAEGNDSDEEQTPDANIKKVYKKCVLVWSGVTHKRVFRSFKFDICRAEQEARKIFKDKNVPQYWDMCRNYVEESHKAAEAK